MAINTQQIVVEVEVDEKDGDAIILWNMTKRINSGELVVRRAATIYSTVGCWNDVDVTLYSVSKPETGEMWYTALNEKTTRLEDVLHLTMDAAVAAARRLKGLRELYNIWEEGNGPIIKD